MQLEKIFKTIVCTNEQKVTYATYVLVNEADYWWRGAKALLETLGTPINWELFKTTFLEKYFSVIVRNKKETEFLWLKQVT